MSDGFTLFTIQGRKARVLKLIIGVPLLLVGAGFGLVGLDSAGGSDMFVPILIGAIIAVVGLRYCVGAIRSNEFAVTLRESSGSQDGGEA